MSKLFISHSSQDDGFVRGVQQALRDHGQDVWIDSRQLRGGGPLWPKIQEAIEGASAYEVVVSTDALQSKWVGKELRHALDVQKQRGKDNFRVFALSLDSIKLGVLEAFFDAEPLYIAVSSGAGGIEAALNAILVAVGKRLPADVTVAAQPKAEPLEELVLELTDLKFTSRMASAAPRLGPGSSMSPPRRGSVKLPARKAGGSSRRSDRSRRKSFAGIWRSSPSGRASISGTGRGRSRRAC